MSGARLHMLALVAVTLLVGALRFANDFVYDDIQLLVLSDFVYDWSNVPALFVNNTMFAADGGEYAATAVVDTYRPLTMLTFFVDGALGGGSPWAFHLSNQLGHLLFVLLAWAGLRRQFPTAPPVVPLMASFALALHPLLNEAHVWINGRSDVWAGVCATAAFALWPRSDGWTVARASGVAALLFAGMLCKEVVLFTVPAMLVWCGLHAGNAWPRAVGIAAGASSISVTLYLGARSLALGGMKAGAGTLEVVEVARRVPLLWWDGLISLLAPRTLMMRHLAEDYAAPSVALVAMAALGSVLLAVCAIATARRAPGVITGLGWFASTLAPATLIAFTPGWVGFGRYLYLPAFGVVVALVAGAAAWRDAGRQTPRVLGLVVGAWLVGMAMFSTIVTLNYQTNLSFYAAIADEQPERAHGHRGVGESLHALGQFTESAAASQRAVDLEPRLKTPHINLSMALLQDGRAAEAQRAARYGLERHATSANLWQLLSLARLQTGEADAIDPLLRAWQLAPEAGWLDAYVQHVVASQPAPWLDALEQRAEEQALHALVDRVRSLRFASDR